MTAYSAYYVTGFEHGLLSTNGGGLANGFTAGVNIQTTTKHSGTYGLQVPLAADNKAWTKNASTGVVHSWGVWVYLSDLPTNDLVVAHVGQLSGTDHRAGIGINASTGKWRLFHRHTAGAIVWGTDGPDAVADTWTFVTFRESTTGLVEGYVDGVELTDVDATAGHAGGTLGVIILGNSIGNTDTLDLYFDDVIGYGAAPSVWPIPEFQVEILVPDGEGTHATAASFTDDSANSPPVNPHLRVDEIPVTTSSTDFVSQTTANSGHFLELTIQAATNREDPIGLCAVGSRKNNSGVSSSALALSIRDGVLASSQAVFTLNFIANTLEFIHSGVQTRASSGSAWTATDVDAFVFRVGASTDVSPIPECHSLFLEVAALIPTAQEIAVGQALETDEATAIPVGMVEPVAQGNETDVAQPITALLSVPTPVGQAEEIDEAGVITILGPLGQTTELNRAQQIAVLGGLSVVSDAPVLIRAPLKAGRIFHQFSGGGEVYHPMVAEWSSEEEAPGGFTGASGLISWRDYQTHPECFQAGSLWRTFLEDGTCIFAGRLKIPDPQTTVVQLSAKGRASIAEREIGPILYQAHVGSEISEFFADSEEWRVKTTTMSHTYTDTGILFTRNPETDRTGNAHVMIPFFGRNIAYLRCHMQGQHGYMAIQTRQRTRIPRTTNSAELDLTTNHAENFYFNFTTAVTAENIAVDLTIGAEMLPSPNSSVFTNEGDPSDAGIGFLWPHVITIEVADWADTPDSSAAEILLTNIEVNGEPVGSSRRYSVGDLVEDIASRLGFRDVNVGGSFDVLPYELPPGVPASEALDWACLISGKRYRILDNGERATFEWGHWNKRSWGLASPWSPLRTIPEERYDTVHVPYSYPGTHGQLTDFVTAKVEDSPLPRRRTYSDVDIGEPAHNRDKAQDLGIQIAEALVRPHHTGDFACAEVIGPDEEKLSAHHMNAGDVLHPYRRAEAGRLQIATLTRFDDHVEGTFAGENRRLAKLLARREKRLEARKK